MLTRMAASWAPLLATPTLSGCVHRLFCLCARLTSSAVALLLTSSTSYQLAARSTLATSGTAPSGTSSGRQEGVPIMPASCATGPVRAALQTVLIARDLYHEGVLPQIRLVAAEMQILRWHSLWIAFFIYIYTTARLPGSRSSEAQKRV